MTIGIALTLEDGALLIADGLTVYPFNETERVFQDSTEKIVRVGPTLAVITLGVWQGTELAVKGLKSAFDAGLDPPPQELGQLGGQVCSTFVGQTC